MYYVKFYRKHAAIIHKYKIILENIIRIFSVSQLRK